MKRRLRVVPPYAGTLPDARASVARALLDRYVPVGGAVDDFVFTAKLGREPGATDALEGDPRYLIGRLVQAASMLLERDVPEPDATAQLLAEAIDDACRWRRRQCAACRGEDVCEACGPDWNRAMLYEALWLQLGIIYPIPRRAKLTAVDR